MEGFFSNYTEIGGQCCSQTHNNCSNWVGINNDKVYARADKEDTSIAVSELAFTNQTIILLSFHKSNTEE